MPEGSCHDLCAHDSERSLKPSDSVVRGVLQWRPSSFSLIFGGPSRCPRQPEGQGIIFGELSDASSLWWTFGPPSGDPTFARGAIPNSSPSRARSDSGRPNPRKRQRSVKTSIRKRLPRRPEVGDTRRCYVTRVAL